MHYPDELKESSVPISEGDRERGRIREMTTGKKVSMRLFALRMKKWSKELKNAYSFFKLER